MTTTESSGRGRRRRSTRTWSPSRRPARDVAGTLESAGYSVLIDDRDPRPGEKFADADLLGCPVRITVGKRSIEDGAVDVRSRFNGEEERAPASSVAEALDARWDSLP